MRAAVCGSPIAHSLSPALHRAAYEALGLTGWSYDLLEVDEERLPGVVGTLDASWAGLSLTMPLKQAVVPLVDEVSDFARAVGSVNTVVVTPRLDRRNTPGRRGVRLRAENTDVIGLVTALAEAGAERITRGVVLGGGATARSAVVALLQAGCPRPVAVVRSPTDALLGAFRPVWWPLLLDVVYAPWPTPLAQRWGGSVVGGFEMLLHQAVAQVELMTGREGPVAAMRAAGLAALADRARA